MLISGQHPINVVYLGCISTFQSPLITPPSRFFLLRCTSTLRTLAAMVVTVNGITQREWGIPASHWDPSFIFLEPNKAYHTTRAIFSEKNTHRKKPLPKTHQKKETCPHLIFDTFVDLLLTSWWFQPLRKIVKMDSSSPRSLVKIKDIWSRHLAI